MQSIPRWRHYIIINARQPSSSCSCSYNQSYSGRSPFHLPPSWLCCPSQTANLSVMLFNHFLKAASKIFDLLHKCCWNVVLKSSILVPGSLDLTPTQSSMPNRLLIGVYTATTTHSSIAWPKRARQRILWVYTKATCPELEILPAVSAPVRPVSRLDANLGRKLPTNRNILRNLKRNKVLFIIICGEVLSSELLELSYSWKASCK
jgi:hypothetical protein